MSFLYPAALFMGLLGLGVIALYLQRPRRRQLEVSSLLFWRRVLEREPQRQFLGRLRNPVSLLLQLLIFFLLLLALARPESQSQGKQSTVVIVDARARMQADGVFDAAIRAARELMSQAGPGHEVALLAVEGEAVVLSPFSTDGRGLREKLDGLTVSDAGGGMEEALTLGRDLLASRPGIRRLVAITDRPLEIADDAEQVLVGKARDNVAILSLAQRPVPSSPQSAEVFVKLGNFSHEQKEIELELSLDGKPIDLKKFSLQAGGLEGFSTLVSEELLRGSRGFFEARVIASDGLAIDNEARAAISAGEPVRVLLLTSGNPFLESALKADPSIGLEILAPESWKAGMGSGFDAVIFDNWMPQGATLEGLGDGAFFFFGRSPFEESGQAERAFALERTAEDSPLLWNVDLSAVRLDHTLKIDVPEGEGIRTTVPLQSGGEPVLFTLERRDHRRVIATGFTVGDSNFPLKAAFPLFVSNAIHWLAGREGGGGDALVAGQTFVPAEGERIAEKPQPGGGDEALTDEARSLTGEPVRLKKNGFYEVRSRGGTPARWLAVNTASEEEADLRTAKSNRNLLLVTLGWSTLRPWQWLALAALGLIVVEWFLHHRRLTE